MQTMMPKTTALCAVEVLVGSRLSATKSRHARQSSVLLAKLFVPSGLKCLTLWVGHVLAVETATALLTAQVNSKTLLLSNARRGRV